MAAFESHPGFHGKALSFVATKESFGILRIPEQLRLSVGMEAFRTAISPTCPPISEISALLVLPSAEHNARQNKHHHLAKLQGTQFAVLPVHTRQETALYKNLQRRLFNGQEPDWIMFAQQWSTHCNGYSIFYKTPEHLQAHDQQWTHQSKFSNTLKVNHEVVQVVRKNLQSKKRRVNAPAAKSFMSIPPVLPTALIAPSISISPVLQNTVPRLILPLPTTSFSQLLTRTTTRRPKSCFHCGKVGCPGAHTRANCPTLS
jgi:hypothetical protein